MENKGEMKEKKYRQIEPRKQKTWDINKFASSPVSQKILKYSSIKFLPAVALIVLLKCLAIVSCKLPRPRLCVGHVGPSRHLKSYTLTQAMKMFAKEFYLDLQSDFTMNSLKRYKKILAQNVCLMINDATTLLASKARRSKDRLVGGLAGIIADEIYIYQDFGKKFTLKGWVTLVLNITSQSYQNNKDRLLEQSTLSERTLMVHLVLSEPEMTEWNQKSQKTADMTFEPVITIDDIETNIQDIPPHFLKLIEIQAREFSYLSLQSYVGCQDLIKGLVRAHAALNKRKEVCTDDFALVSYVKEFLVNPFSPYEGQIVKLRAQGLSYRSIEKAIGKSNYLHQIYEVVKKAQLRGILPLETKND